MEHFLYLLLGLCLGVGLCYAFKKDDPIVVNSASEQSVVFNIDMGFMLVTPEEFSFSQTQLEHLKWGVRLYIDLAEWIPLDELSVASALERLEYMNHTAFQLTGHWPIFTSLPSINKNIYGHQFRAEILARFNV